MNSCIIAYFINRLNTANKLKKKVLIVPYTKDIYNILYIINSEATGILQYKKLNSREIEITLLRQFQNISIISTLGKRIYIKANQIRTYNRGLGFYIIRTSKGGLTALNRNIGGELLLKFI